MEKIAAFEKVSLEQMIKDAVNPSISDGIARLAEQGYDISSMQVIKDYVDEAHRSVVALPRRATEGSAGYDICSPFSIKVKAGKPVTIATGLRCWIADGWVLVIVPRSGLACRHGLRLMNTAGVIDSDYYRADNEGHIILKMIADDDFEIAAGDRVAQGIFLPYGITTDDSVILRGRTGGFGSTGQ